MSRVIHKNPASDFGVGLVPVGAHFGVGNSRTWTKQRLAGGNLATLNCLPNLWMGIPLSSKSNTLLNIVQQGLANYIFYNNCCWLTTITHEKANHLSNQFTKK